MIVNKNISNKKSITPSGFFGNDKSMIVELENFMTEDEVNYLESAAKSISIWDITETHSNENGTIIYDADYWKDRVATEKSLNKNDLRICKVLDNLFKRLQVEIESFYSVKVNPTGKAIVRWMPGQFQNPHADKELHEGPDAGKPNDFPYYDIASLFYLNDDYLGGELYFPLQNIRIKPKRGSAYFFPGDKNYIHGVTKVESGTRYTCPFFWTILEHTGSKQP